MTDTPHSSTSREENPAHAQETAVDTPRPPPVTVEELTDDEADELRESTRRPMNLEEVHLELSTLARRVKRGRIDPKRAWFLKDLLLAVAQVVKPLEEIRELRRLNENVERAEGGARLTHQVADDLSDDELAEIARRGRPALEALPADTDTEEL